MEINLVDILTAVGIPVAAAMVTGLVELFKRIVPVLGRRQYEPQLAAAIAAVLVAAAMAVRISDNPVFGLGGFVSEGFIALMAWYGITRLAMGIHDDLTAAPGSLSAAAGAEPPK